jgi:RimJ/RimL family protein N-acetyltransferase
LRYAFRHLGAKEIELTTNEKNQRALRCFLATGFTEKNRVHGAISYEDERADMIEMSIDIGTWQATNRDS